MFQVCLVLVVGVFGDSSEMTESESVIHSLPPTPLHTGYPQHLPYSPIVYPGYGGYPGYKEAILLRSPFNAREVQDALRTKDGDITVS